MSAKLHDGDDSRNVSDKVKFQLFVNGLGICAAPDCDARLMQNQTKLGECAHIIPKIVGSHSREDYTTPLKDRRKEPNLIYLCKTHHDIVDNEEHAHIYTADILRKWKKDHETWAAGIRKSSPYFPVEFREMFDDFGRQIAEKASVSASITTTLLENCHELIHRQLLNEAKVLLSQIDIILIGANNESLNAKADLLNALLLVRKERIPEAKQQLLQIIQTYPHRVDAMLEYVEICDRVPELTDDVIRIEKLARDLAEDSPRLKFIDLVRKYKKQEVIDLPDISEHWSIDVRLNAQYICQYALYFDGLQHTTQRDALIDRLEEELPKSPRPHLFRVVFAIHDMDRLPTLSPVEQVRQIQTIVEFSAKERKKATNDKDPLSLRDEISWFMQELRLELAFEQFSEKAKNHTELCIKIILLIAQCYFDSYIDGILIELLHHLRIDVGSWRTITRKILESMVMPSLQVISLLFLQGLQHDELVNELENFTSQYGYDDLLQILKGIEENDVDAIAVTVNRKNDSIFSLLLLNSMNDNDMMVALSERLEVNEDYHNDLLYARLKGLIISQQNEEAIALIKNLPIDQASPYALSMIERTIVHNEQWNIFIPVALRLLSFEISNSYKAYIYGELALAYSHLGDDTNVIIFAEQALQYELLDNENACNVLHILALAHMAKGTFDEACTVFQQYEHIKRSFFLFLIEADLYLKSSIDDKHQKSLSLILQAFENASLYSADLFLSAQMLLIELSNAGAIPFKDESVVEDGLFLKISGFENGWFYVGAKGNAFDAEWIKPNTSNYNAVIGKETSADVKWPSDKYTSPEKRRTILHICTPASYLCWRASEEMARVASLGNAPIWQIQVIKEDGTLDLENLEQFYDEHFQSDNKFFELYISMPMPFSFLCTTFGSLTQAVGRIASEKKGFIHCNIGTPESFQTQEAIASDVLDGAGCYIGGLAALVLAEAKLLEKVIDAVPNLGVSTSVIRFLRNIAHEVDTSTSSAGHATFVDGKFEFRPRDKEKEDEFRNILLQSANLLDALPNKVIGKIYPKVEEERTIDTMLPDYFVDAFRYAQEQDGYILTDDALLTKVYEHAGELPIPKHFSSFSLIRQMAYRKQIAWVSYLRYFALLSSYRYHFLFLTVDDMILTVFPQSESGLITATPRNLDFLNFRFTLSQEYGVSDQAVIGILSTFFTKLIQDESVPNEVADEIFARTILQGLAGRDKKQMSRVLFQICSRNTLDAKWISQRTKSKIQTLENQLRQFAQGFNPLVIESSLLLKRRNYQK